jgi:Cdc6-like AAA superfamily ATPase
VKESVRQTIKEVIARAPARYRRLILLVGPSGSGKTRALQEISAEYGKKINNVNLEMAKVLREMPVQRHQSRAARVFSDMIRDVQDNEASENATMANAIILLDNIEVLFDTSLKLDPLLLLQGVARNCTVLASWNGTFTDKRLTFAVSGHPEYRFYDSVDAQIIEFSMARRPFQTAQTNVFAANTIRREQCPPP